MSRPVTIEDLRRVLEAIDGIWSGHGRLITAALDALAALPAEQATPSGCGCWYAAEDGVACEHEQPAASEPQDSAVPELPPIAQDFVATPPSQGTGYPCVRQRDYAALRTAAESLLRRLVEALEAGEHWHKQWQSECVENISLRKQLVPALQERDEARALAWEQARITESCDEAIHYWRQAWRNQAALVGDWRQRAEQAVAERDALRAQLDQAQRQEPVAWWLGSADGHECGGFYLTQPQSRNALPLYAAPVPTADTAQQIAAAEQRGRAAAFEAVASECERREAGLNTGWVKVEMREMRCWCRKRAEEARG